MKRLNKIFIVSAILSLILQACNLQLVESPADSDVELTITANAALIEIALAQGQPGTEEPPLEGNNAPPPEEVVIPAQVLPPAVGDVTVTVSVATNCRLGPGQNFASVYGMPVGQVAKVVAKNSYSGYWIIEIPGQNGQNGQTCWLWGQYATVTGDTSSLKDVVTPTSAATLKPTATNTPIITATATSTTAAGAPAVAGCTSPTASNYNPAATVDDGSCVFTAQATILGCTDPTATNYNSKANSDDGSCLYQTKPNAPIITNSSIVCVDQNDGNFEFQVTIDWADNSDNETGFGWSKRVAYNSNIISRSGGASSNTASPNTHREFTGIYPAGAIFTFNVSASNSAGESSNSVSLTCP